MTKQISCRRARREMQDALDRADQPALAESEGLTMFLPGEVRAHLEGCSGCQDFLRSLCTFAPALRRQLDESLRACPDPQVAAALQELNREESRLGPSNKPGQAAIPAVLQRIRDWLFAPAGKTAAVYHWAVVLTIALMLASFVGVRVYQVSRTQRVIEEQVDRVVELIYQEPLLAGVESALLRTQPTISDYMEDLDLSAQPWLEETVSQPYLN